MTQPPNSHTKASDRIAALEEVLALAVEEHFTGRVSGGFQTCHWAHRARALLSRPKGEAA